MKRFKGDERGTTLILALAFMVIVVAVLIPLVESVTAGFNARNSLDQTRAREYAADGAIQYSIAQLRGVPASPSYSGPGVQSCGPYAHTINGFTIHVDCNGAPVVTLTGILQYDVVFTACQGASPCGGPSSPVLIRAQVNFRAQGSGASLQITGTSVQSWSVNG